MKPISNWNDVQPIIAGETSLPAGGYICRILAVKEEMSSTKKNMLVINFDIAEGDYKDYYMNKYKNSAPRNDSEPIKWKGKYYIVLEGDNWEGRFKGFITTLQESNPQFNWELCNWDTSKLTGLYFGGIFREEEFEGQNGVARNTKLYLVRSVDTIRKNDFKIPEPKLLESVNAPFTDNTNMTSKVTDDDLPF